MKSIVAWFRRRRAERIAREHAEGSQALRRAIDETPWRVHGIEREQGPE